MVFSLILIMAACQKSEAAAPEISSAAAVQTTEDTTSAAQGLKEFTKEELAKYDGKNGNPAYVAVDGKVYDVSMVPEWKNGTHQGRFQAGRDLSKEILLSPHGKDQLKMVPMIGILK